MVAQKDQYIVPMVARAVDILSYLSREGGFHGIHEISYVLDIPKATVFKVLYTLQQAQFITKNAEDQYALGLAFLTFSSELKNNLDFRTYTKPIMERVARNCGESVNLGLLMDDTVVVMDTAKGEDFFIVRQLIPYSPLYCSGMGKIFLSSFTQEEFEDYLRRTELAPRTVSTLTDPGALNEDRLRTREKGLGYDREEYEYGLTCIATGIHHQGKLLAAVSISGPTSRLKHKGMGAMEEAVLELAREMEAIPGIEELLKST
ncbi:MAG: IclR family transcriptional regulator [Tissierellia bacterium]|nr:IclR family transcriptional regulator [Tissierellia bacterium]